ncbi:MAG: L,D-transpeptidase family protein [Ruminococcus sp.]|jgi:lipoprotein-anchoring transpeptidase ErfK/SrfK
MQEGKKGNGTDNIDAQISLAMDKIVQDTIGDIAIPDQPDKTRHKKKKAAPEKTSWVDIPEENPDEESGKKKSWLKRAVVSLVILLVLAGAGIYGYFTYYYSDKFFPNTTINNIACGEMTPSQAEEIIRRNVEDYSIQLDFRGNTSFTINGSDFQYEYEPDGSVEKIQKEQNPFLWFLGYLQPQKYEVAENITYDEGELEGHLMTLEPMQTDNMTEPVNAWYTFQNGHFEIIPEEEGNTIDTNTMMSAVKKAVSEGQTELSVEDCGAYAEPEVRSDNEALNAEVEELNSLMTASIHYWLPGGEEVLDGNILRDWLLKDETGHYVKDEATIRAKAAEYVDALADRVDTVGAERPFTTTSGLQITVSGGSYGWKINQTQEVEELVKNIMNNDQLGREPVYTSREVTTENNGFGNTYVEINLTDQHLYYYQDGQVVVDSPFVSGKMTSDRWTPPGIFTLTYKQLDKVLRGEKRADGSYSYESPVTFWMPFNGGIGLHDSSWRSSYGGTIYIYSGSHGCINMPYDKAKAVYNLITKDVPIICFYTEPYTLY